MSADNLAGVLSLLSLNSSSVKDSTEFANTVVSHVTAEPRLVSRLFPKLVEQVSDDWNRFSELFLIPIEIRLP
jgi:hypothetical protein